MTHLCDLHLRSEVSGKGELVHVKAMLRLGTGPDFVAGLWIACFPFTFRRPALAAPPSLYTKERIDESKSSFLGNKWPERHHFLPSWPRPVRQQSCSQSENCRLLAMAKTGKERQGSMVWHFSAPALMAGQLNSVRLRRGRTRAENRGKTDWENFQLCWKVGPFCSFFICVESFLNGYAVLSLKYLKLTTNLSS